MTTTRTHGHATIAEAGTCPSAARTGGLGRVLEGSSLWNVGNVALFFRGSATLSWSTTSVNTASSSPSTGSASRGDEP
jgi:hypothetical protein